MTFIGIISDNKSFETIKENLNVEDISLIHINNKSIENIKNITFKTIIINKNLKNLEKNISIIQKLCIKCEYLIINTDIKLETHLESESKANIITFGLNHKATVTVSSITDTSILIYLQRNIKNKDNEIIEVGEKQIEVNKQNKIKTYEILIIYIISIINNIPIMLKI